MTLPRLAFVVLAFAACGSKPPKQESPIVKDTGPPEPDTCCCKSTPIGAIDGKPIFEPSINRIECSTKQGTCMPEVQCQKPATEP